MAEDWTVWSFTSVSSVIVGYFGIGIGHKDVSLLLLVVVALVLLFDSSPGTIFNSY
jgi:hypothetical protein